MNTADNTPALPCDLLHGLTLRPPVAAWDGLRYQGSVPAHARLDQAQAMSGVVAAVQREHFLGVVAVAPVHARQALASLVPVWKDGQAALQARPVSHSPGSQESYESIDTGRYVWRMAGARAPVPARHAWPRGAWTVISASGCRRAKPTYAR